MVQFWRRFWHFIKNKKEIKNCEINISRNTVNFYSDQIFSFPRTSNPAFISFVLCHILLNPNCIVVSLKHQFLMLFRTIINLNVLIKRYCSVCRKTGDDMMSELHDYLLSNPTSSFEHCEIRAVIMIEDKNDWTNWIG